MSDYERDGFVVSDDECESSESEDYTDSEEDEFVDPPLVSLQVPLRPRARTNIPPQLKDSYMGLVSQIGNQGKQIRPLIANLRKFDEIQTFSSDLGIKSIDACRCDACGLVRECHGTILISNDDRRCAYSLGSECFGIVENLLEMAKLLKVRDFSRENVLAFEQRVCTIGKKREKISSRYR